MNHSGTGSVRRGVLWDLDGVIADTNELHYESWQLVLPDFGIEMTDQDHQKTFGMNNRKILTILTGEEPEPELLREISHRKESTFRSLARGKVKPLPGVISWLKRFEAWGARQAIASSAPMENISVMAASMEIESYFQAQVSGFKLPAKPDPEVYLEAARGIDVPSDHCLVIEDAVVGVQGAHNAGMVVIGVTTTHKASELKEAELVVDRLSDLDEQEVRKLLIGE